MRRWLTERSGFAQLPLGGDFYAWTMTSADTKPTGAGRRVVDKFQGASDKAKSTRTGQLVWRTAIIIVGVALIALGIVLLPLPGPGWLIIFGGLGVLATEFDWAKRLLGFAREQVGRWTDWVKRQSRPVQALVGILGLVFLVGVAFGAWSLSR